MDKVLERYGPSAPDKTDVAWANHNKSALPVAALRDQFPYTEKHKSFLLPCVKWNLSGMKRDGPRGKDKSWLTHEKIKEKNSHDTFRL